MAEKKSKMVTAVFRDRIDAQSAHDRLLRRGYTSDEINVLMSDATRRYYVNPDDKATHAAGTMATEGMGVGGAIGTAVGATIAAIAAVAAPIVIPGLGLFISGPIVAALAGAGAGALTGGVVGGLVGLGIPESNAAAYEDALRNGGVAIGVVPRNDKDADEIQKDFKELRGENIYYS